MSAAHRARSWSSWSRCATRRCCSAGACGALEAARRAARGLPDLTVAGRGGLDGCTDGPTVDRAAHLDVTSWSSTAGCVGAARGAGSREALGPVRPPTPAAIWIANTDADSAVPAGWLLEQVALADGGADVVVGTVRPDPADLYTEQFAAWQGDPLPGRPNGHVHGANLGVRADAYLAAGGFPDRARARGRRPAWPRLVASGATRGRVGRRRTSSPRDGSSAGHPAATPVTCGRGSERPRTSGVPEDEAESA